MNHLLAHLARQNRGRRCTKFHVFRIKPRFGNPRGFRQGRSRMPMCACGYEMVPQLDVAYVRKIWMDPELPHAAVPTGVSVTCWHRAKMRARLRKWTEEKPR